jgi:hypothetical protein
VQRSDARVARPRAWLTDTETVERLRARGAERVGEVVPYRDVYRLCYIRGPEGLLIGLAQQLK